MATYKNIKGFKVQSLASDPTASETVGKVWYNTAGNVLKYNTEGAAAWSAGGDFPEAGCWSTGTCGTQGAGMSAGGYGRTDFASSATYDGTSWTAIPSINDARYGNGGAGSVTAAITFGGQPQGPPPYTSKSETYDGSTWTEEGEMNNARHYFASTNSSPQTSCLGIGGTPPAGALTEEWNGTSWTEVATEFITNRYSAGAAGTTTAAVFFLGSVSGTASLKAETWNGTSWTEVTDAGTARYGPGAAGATSTAALAYGGTYHPATFAVVESWNGTSWTEVSDLTVARFWGTSIGTGAVALCGGGSVGLTTEEWNDPVYTTKTVTTS